MHFTGRVARREFLQAAAVATAVGSFSNGHARAAEGLPAGVLRVIEPDAASGSSQAVVVGDVPLVHTAQTQFASTLVYGYSPTVEQLISGLVTPVAAELESALARAGSSLDDVVKFNFYLDESLVRHGRPAVLEAVRQWMAARYAGTHKPAITFVAPSPVGYLSADCIAVRRQPVEPGQVVRVEGAAVLPPTNKLYVSGDAGTGNLATATVGTLESLERTLKFCGLDWSHVVQLKSFVQPLDAVAEVRRTMQTFFGDRPLPILSFVGWKSSETVPIEIELIAAVPPELGNPSQANVEYLTPPGMKASPVFSRAARVCSRQTIYTSGLYGESAGADMQVREVFGKLKQIVESCGGDLDHLAKATYYVTQDDVSKALGAIRPEFYDPARPPAASKAMVTGIARADRSLAIDMIAVPR